MAKKLSAFNLFMRKRIKGGMSFSRAAKSWRRKGKGLISSITKRGEGDAMARRRRGSRRVGRRSSRRGRRGGRGMMGGFGGIERTVLNAGMGYAAGVGTKALLEKYATTVPSVGGLVAPFSKYIGAYAAYKTGGEGLSGAAAAIPLVLNGSMPGSGNTASGGVGDFV